MSGASEVVVGVDAGGTRTRGVAVADDGRIVAWAEHAAGNARTAGAEAARAAIEATVTELRREAAAPIAHVTLGLAGRIDAAAGEEASGWAHRLQVAAVSVDSDARIAHAAAFGRDPGVAVVAGTGSQVLALGPDGSRLRVGGWGPTFGDEGSAFWIAREAIASALRDLDAGRSTELARELTAYAGAADASGDALTVRLLDVLYAPAGGLSAHARFAPRVAALAKRGDVGCVDLLQRAGESLAEMAAVAARRAGCTHVAGSGGVLEHVERVRSGFEEGLRRRGLTPLRPPWQPVLGAAYLAMLEAGWEAERSSAGWAAISPGSHR